MKIAVAWNQINDRSSPLCIINDTLLFVVWRNWLSSILSNEIDHILPFIFVINFVFVFPILLTLI